MSARHVPLGAMFRWVSGALHLLVTHPGAMLGAGAIMLGVAILVSVPMIVMMAPMMADLSANPTHAADPAALAQMGAGRIGALYGLTLLLNLVLMPPLVMGWMRLLRSLDAGHGGSALDLLAPYRDGAAWLRGIGFTVLAIVAAIVLIALFAAAFWSPISGLMAQAAANQVAVLNGQTPAPPEFSGALVFGYFAFVFGMGLFQLGSFVGFAELALRPTSSVPAALGRGLLGVLRNLPWLIVWALALSLVAIVVMLVVGLVLGLLGAVLAMVSPKLAFALFILLYIPILLAIYPLMHAGAYLAWKDMLGDDAAPEGGATEPLVA